MAIKTYNPIKCNSSVVALHSSASSSRQWKQLAECMEHRFDVLACELPGYAASEYTRCDLHTGMLPVAEPILNDICKFGKPVHLVGHSFGGAVAIKIALARPDLVKSLTLYEPATFHIMNNDDSRDRKHYYGIKQIEQTLASATTTGHADQGMKTFVDFWNGKSAWDSISQSARNHLAGCAKSVIADFSNLFTETWELDCLDQLNIPTLMIMGMDSPAITQRIATQIAGHIRGAKLAMLPDLGHMAPVSDPKWVNPRIHQHIALVERSVKQISWPQTDAA